MKIKLYIKPFSFKLNHILRTSTGSIKEKEGWLICLKGDNGSIGWGEIAPLNKKEKLLIQKLIARFKQNILKEDLEKLINIWPGSLSFGFGAALAEIDGLVGSKSEEDWLAAPQSALLLGTNENIIKELKTKILLFDNKFDSYTIKWKVGIEPNSIERIILKEMLKIMPENWRIRIDANGSWDLNQAIGWAEQLCNESRLDWIEQPLNSKDIKGHKELSKLLPIALDESLFVEPSLREEWDGWQIRRPLIEGDPRILLKQLQEGKSNVVITTGFETGIGRRWINHLAGLQNTSSKPIAPGLAPGWCPENALFSSNPKSVWEYK